MDDQVLSVQLDPSRMTDDFDPVPEVIVRVELNRAVSANYNDFLTGIKLIQEIDLDLSRSDIFVQNTRRMLEASKKQVTIIS